MVQTAWMASQKVSGLCAGTRALTSEIFKSSSRRLGFCSFAASWAAYSDMRRA